VFEPSGCCYANQFIIAQQTPKGSSPENITILPPCVQRYNYMQCPQVSLSDNMCTYGANQNVTVIQGFVELKDKPTAGGKLGPGFPDVYDKVSVVNLQGAISTALSFAASGVIKLPAINVQITNYSYFNALGNSLTPTSGSGISPDQSDYANAESAQFWFNVVLVYSSVEEAEVNNLFIGSSTFKTIIGIAYGLPAAKVDAYSTTGTPYFFQAEPFDTTHTSSAGVGAPFSLAVTGVSVLLCFVGLTMW
jgi:hypothetical protein